VPSRLAKENFQGSYLEFVNPDAWT